MNPTAQGYLDAYMNKEAEAGWSDALGKTISENPYAGAAASGLGGAALGGAAGMMFGGKDYAIPGAIFGALVLAIADIAGFGIDEAAGWLKNFFEKDKKTVNDLGADVIESAKKIPEAEALEVAAPYMAMEQNVPAPTMPRDQATAQGYGDTEETPKAYAPAALASLKGFDANKPYMGDAPLTADAYTDTPTTGNFPTKEEEIHSMGAGVPDIDPSTEQAPEYPASGAYAGGTGADIGDYDGGPAREAVPSNYKGVNQEVDDWFDEKSKTEQSIAEARKVAEGTSRRKNLRADSPEVRKRRADIAAAKQPDVDAGPSIWERAKDVGSNIKGIASGGWDQAVEGAGNVKDMAVSAAGTALDAVGEARAAKRGAAKSIGSGILSAAETATGKASDHLNKEGPVIPQTAPTAQKPAAPKAAAPKKKKPVVPTAKPADKPAGPALPPDDDLPEW